MSRAKRKTLQAAGSWVMVRKEMKESPAWRALPDNARRVLDRLEVEHMRHAGTQNGRLIVTYDDFSAWGLRRSSVSLSIRQCVSLGFLEVTRAGRRSAAGFKMPSMYRLTYVWGRPAGAREPTDEWRAIASPAEAESALDKVGTLVRARVSQSSPSPEV